MQADIARLFAESNFDAYDSGEDRYPRILLAALAQLRIPPSDVLAVTHTLSLVAATTTCIFEARERGMLNKRLEIGEVVQMERVATAQGAPDGRFGSRVDVLDHSAKVLMQIKYGTGGPVRPEHAAAEARRFASVVARAAVA